jgi:hypothetical protein
MILRLFLDRGRVEESFASCVEFTILWLYIRSCSELGNVFLTTQRQKWFLLQVGWKKNEKKRKRMR